MAKCLAYKSDFVAGLGKAELGLAGQVVAGIGETGFLSSPNTRCQTTISTRTGFSNPSLRGTFGCPYYSRESSVPWRFASSFHSLISTLSTVAADEPRRKEPDHFPDLRDAHTPVWEPAHRDPVQPLSRVEAGAKSVAATLVHAHARNIGSADQPSACELGRQSCNTCAAARPVDGDRRVAARCSVRCRTRHRLLAGQGQNRWHRPQVRRRRPCAVDGVGDLLAVSV
jgi:hypothetical protein